MTATQSDARAGVVTVRRVIPADHPAFAGHFPGSPLLPGVSLLAEVIEAALAVPAIAQRLGAAPGVPAAKFLAPVRPGDAIDIRLMPIDAPAGAAVRFEVHCGTAIAASGQIAAGASA